MNTKIENIDPTPIVAAIKAAEAAGRAGASSWEAYAREQQCRGGYAYHVTGLYTLRAWLRGRLHRHNPPAPIRDFNRSFAAGQVIGGRPLRWNRLEHNRRVALEALERFLPASG